MYAKNDLVDGILGSDIIIEINKEYIFIYTLRYTIILYALRIRSL